MKLIRVIGHPFTVMILFSLVLISGQHLGGFYLLYILLGLPYAVLHAWIALAGLAAMFTGHKLFRKKMQVLRPLFYIFSCGLMILALLLFFDASKGYNDATFTQTLPLISLFVFGLSLTSNLALAIHMLVKLFNHSGARLHTV